MPWNVFYSYSHKDESWLRRLETFLAPLRQNKLIDEWHDRKIRPGADWNSEIDSRIQSADLAIMLLSSDFLASEYCFGVEMETALARVKSNDLQLVPVLMRHCLWEESQFSELQMIPRDEKPVSKSRPVDQALKAVALEIRTIVSQEKAKPKPAPVSATPEAMLAPSLDLVRNQVQAYARLYERTRQRLPSSNDRTLKMEAIFQKMRSIAIASYPLLNKLSNSPSPGDRLAAVSILQTFADEASLDFLVELIGSEKKPFDGYHAARALRFAVGALDSPSYPKLRSALHRAQELLQRASVGLDNIRRSELSVAETELEAMVASTASPSRAHD